MTVLLREDLGEGLLRLTLNRPEKRNALSPELRHALRDAFLAIAEDGAVRGVLLTGAGGHFSAGGDISTMKETTEDEARARLEDTQATVRAILGCPKPLISFVEGHAAGAGASLALLADLALAAPSAVFTFSFMNLGLLPDWAMLWSLPRRVGPAQAQRLIMERARLPAEEALRLGLVDGVVEDPLERAKAFAQGPADGLAAAKRLLHGDGLEAALALELAEGPKRFVSAEFKAGLAAFKARKR
jgi:2-(1,2-epoxy-1,2-dihydrophenyl)acetyl-CoA isomerase